MPRYYFNVRDEDGGDIPDPVGIELPDIEAARSKAREIARILLEVEFRHASASDKQLVQHIPDFNGLKH
jgi:hypothetical protein